MKRSSLALPGAGSHLAQGWAPDRAGSLSDHATIEAWSDAEIEAMARSDPDHPALDDDFWRLADDYSASERAFQKLDLDDLRKLSALALAKLDDLAERLPERPSGANRDRLRFIALAQGGALHFVDGRNGVKDFDVWAFFEQGASPEFPHRAMWHADFGVSRFGKAPSDAAQGYAGRRVDIFGRSIAFEAGDGPQEALARWLRSGSASARHLAARPVIGLYPYALLGHILWPGP